MAAEEIGPYKLLSALAGMVANELLEVDDVVERELLHEHFDQALADRLSGFDRERQAMADALLADKMFDRVVVDDAEGADAGGREVEQRGRAEAPGAEAEHPCVEERALPGLADLWEREVPRVARALRLRERAGECDGEAELLPTHEARLGAGDAGVAHVPQRGGGERRAGAACAVQHHGSVAVRRDELDVALQLRPRHVQRVGQVPRAELFSLAHVDERVRDRLGAPPIIVSGFGLKLAGLTFEMIYAGQPEKGIIVYNRWARFAGFAPMALVAKDPLIIDLGHIVVQIVDGVTIRGLKCR
jgi:hypothetical protein